MKILSKAIASMTIASIISTNVAIIASAIENNTGHITQLSKVSILESKGWLESISVEWKPIKEAKGYNVYYKLASESYYKYKKIDDELIRQYSSYFRADILGLSEGEYIIKVIPTIDNKEEVSL